MRSRILYRLLPFLFPVVAVAAWEVAFRAGAFPVGLVPSPTEVLRGFQDEVRQGRMFDDIVASLYRVTAGFAIAVVLGVPLGMLIGLRLRTRRALLPTVNFLRNMSPLAWMPFAIMWFGIGDSPVIFLVFMAACFPIAIAVAAAVANIPSVYFRVARDYGLRRTKLVTDVTFHAILPQLITSLRVTIGLSWVVLVAAEMIAGRAGLGFLIYDARNQLRPDLLVVGMIVIGVIGVVTDRLILQLTKIPSVRWGYEK